MGQKSSKASRKKCNQDSPTISPQKKDIVVKIYADYCSTYLSKSGLLALGEYRNQQWDERNAVVTFRDPATAEVKGWESFFLSSVLLSLFVACLWCNTQGRAITANKFDVYSVICFLYNKKQYLGVSGDKEFFEVFDVSRLKADQLLSKRCIYLS